MKHAEEELAQLVQLRIGAIIEPDQKKIRKFLKQRHLDEVALIKQSSIKNLNEAFPGICGVLRLLEQQV